MVTKPIQAIESRNDCVIRFANVNGSGSASANNLFAKCVFRLGIPVSPKNIFPSNIQGLPTWYEVRISENGYLGRRGGIDFVVAVNSKTLRKDYESLLPGGYFLFDSTKPLPDEFNRDDVITFPIPLTDLCNKEFESPRLRQLLKNIIYVGALASLFSMDFSILTDSIKKQFKTKPKLAEPNIRALEIGFNYADKHFTNQCRIKLKKTNRTGDSILLDGNSATALGALYAGATVVGWYPITPSTSVIEAFQKYSDKYRTDESGRKKCAILQAEDELAALGIVIGAAWNGARSFTATSGPGLSLMSEFLGLAYYAEIPVVLIDVQRSGPSTGMPTRTQQSDLLAAAYASHGDTKNVLLFPSDPAECFSMTADAFDLAERLQTPVLIMSDLDLGMNDSMCSPLVWDNSRKYDRGKVLNAQELESMQEKWGRYRDIDNDGICYRTYPGTHPEKGAYFTRGTSHDEYSGYTEDSAAYAQGMERLLTKWLTAKKLVPPPVTHTGNRSEFGIIYFGTSTHSCHEAVMELEQCNIHIDTMRLRSFPFNEQVEKFIHNHKHIFVVEQNRDGQMKKLLTIEGNFDPTIFFSICNMDGMPITANYIKASILKVIEQKNFFSHPTQEGDRQ